MYSCPGVFLAVAMSAVGADHSIIVGHQKQLFLDDYLVASMVNVQRQIHPAKKYAGNPLLWPREPWEGKVAILYGSVLRDGDKYRMWYHNGTGVAYAESVDGLRWTKPPLGLFEIDGRKTNTVVKRDAKSGEPNAIPHFHEIFGVYKDMRDPDPSRRYKMGFLSIGPSEKGQLEDPFHHGQRRGLGVAGSPDGIHWKLITSWSTDAICDGGTYWFFDCRANKYVLYGRTKFVSPGLLDQWHADSWVERHYWGRSVARVESPDFLHWNITKPAAAPVVMTADAKDQPGDEIYSMFVFPYESVFIALVQVFHNRPDACYLDIQLAVSHDSIHFARVGNRNPFLPCGPVGCWDRFNNSVANNLPIAVGNELWFYYGGRTYRHSPYTGPDKGEPGGGIGLAVVKRDRFVSLAASFAPGTIVTKPVRFHGTTLHVNAAAPFGRIIVELLDGSGQVIAKSRPIRKDALDIPVKWQYGSLPDSHRPVTMRLTLINAHLYAFWSE